MSRLLSSLKESVATLDEAGRLRVPDRAALAAVAQSGGDAVDGEVDGPQRALVGVPRPVAAQERELDVVQRVQVGEAVADRAGERRVVGEELARARDREEPVARRV